MFTKITYTLVAAFFLASASLAADFQRTGLLDLVQLEQQKIVINDVPYTVSDNLVVHSTTSRNLPASRLRSGMHIGYKLARGGRLITEIWLLPRDYKERQR